MLQRTSARTTVDTDHISPDCLKAAFGVLVDQMVASGLPLDWNTAEMAQNRRADETDIFLRVGLLP